MSNLSIVDSYVKSLLIHTEEPIEILLDNIKQISQCINQDPFIKDVLYNSVIPINVKTEIWKTLSSFIDVKPRISSLISTMINNARMNLLENLIISMQQKVDEKNGKIRVSIVVPVQPDVKTKNLLSKSLDKVFNGKVLPEFTVDESIVGGFIASTNQYVLDFSYKTKLDNLRKAFGVK